MATTDWVQKAGQSSETETDNVEEGVAGSDTEWVQKAGQSSDTAVNNITTLVEQAETAEANAAASETAAAASATAAASSATSASTSATSASTSASGASASETAAAASETAAATSESNAASSASAASTSASNAATSQSNAASSASAASTSETNAATSASNASTSETNAALSAAAALTSASEAAASAASIDLDSIDINGGTIDGTVIGGTAPAAGSFTTGSFTGDVSFGDNDKAIFGAGSDLEIFHSGTSSYIRDVGDGDLQIFATDDVFIRGYATNNYMARFAETGAVTLYHNNASKLATTSTGIDVDGTVTADGLTVDGNSTVNGQLEVASTSPYFKLTDTDVTGFARILGSSGNLYLDADPSNQNTNSQVYVRVDGRNVAVFDDTGDISFYEDTGTTPKFFWDASAESLGIGTSSPDATLHVADSGAANDDFTALITAFRPSLTFGDNSSSSIDWQIFVDSNDIQFRYGDSDTGTKLVNEAMRIDSSGNVGIGTISPSAKLMVVEDANDIASALFYNSAGGSGSIQGKGYIGFGISEGWNFHGAEIGWDQEALSGYRQALTFSTRENSDVRPTERMRIDSSGNLLVGTTVGSDPLTVSGVTLSDALQEGYTSLSGTTPSIDADTAGSFALTTSGNTTFTFASVTSGRSVGFVLKLTAGGSHTITWPSSVDWAGGAAPDAPASGETDVLVFYTVDGGTTWYGALSIDAAA